MPINKPQKIFVVGMHRSGTSLVTKLINLAGFDIGDKFPFNKNHSNPTGHWENREALIINQKLMMIAGGPNVRWCTPFKFSDNWLSKVPKELTKKAQKIQPYVMKDPRFCLTLPFWKTIFDIKCVVVQRDLEKIVQSLIRRSYDTMMRREAENLCRFYLSKLNKNLQDVKYSTVKFDDLFTKDPADIIKKRWSYWEKK